MYIASIGPHSGPASKTDTIHDPVADSVSSRARVQLIEPDTWLCMPGHWQHIACLWGATEARSTAYQLLASVCLCTFEGRAVGRLTFVFSQRHGTGQQL